MELKLSHEYIMGVAQFQDFGYRRDYVSIKPIMEIIHASHRARMVLFEQVPDEYDPSIGTTYGDAQARAIKAFMDFCNEMDKKDGY